MTSQPIESAVTEVRVVGVMLGFTDILLLAIQITVAQAILATAVLIGLLIFGVI